MLSLDDCLRLGLERSLVLANARRDIQIAESGIGQTRAQVLPHLDLSAYYTRLDEVPTLVTDTGSTPLGRRDQYGVNAELSQLLYNGGQVNAALRAARDYRRFAAWGRTAAEADLRLRITLAFHHLLFAQATVDVAASNRDQLQGLYDQAEARRRQLLASEYEALAARVRLANALPPLIAASNAAQIARIALADLIRIDPPVFTLQGHMTPPPDTRALSDFLAAGARLRPEVRQLQLQLQLREEDLRAERGTRYPEIKAFADYDGVNPPPYSTGAAEWEWSWSVGLRATWPIFDGGLRHYRILEKSIELEKTRDTLDDFHRTVALEIRQAYLDFQKARETIAAESDTRALAEKALSIATARYGEGLATALDVSDSNLALNQARLTQLHAEREAGDAWARLRLAAGLMAPPPPEENP